MSSSNKRAKTATAARGRQSGAAATQRVSSDGSKRTKSKGKSNKDRVTTHNTRHRDRAAGGPALVVGAVSPAARATGAVAVLAAVCRLLAPVFPLVTERGGNGASGGSGVGAAANVFDFVAPLVAAATLGTAGVLTVRARLPRFGMAVIAAFGAASLGLLLQTVFLYQDGRTSRDLPLPVAMVRSFLYEPATGLHLRLAAHALSVLALVLVLRTWPRTWMEDDGSFDALRPRFGAVSLFAGFLGAAGLSLPGGDSDFPTLGPQSILGRFGLDAWGVAVFAAVLLVGAVVAPSLRPRLATVGMYLGLAAVTGVQALDTVLLVARVDSLHANLAGALLVLAGVAFVLLALAAWRMSRDRAPEHSPA